MPLMLLLWPVAHVSYFLCCQRTGCIDKAGGSTFVARLLTVAAALIEIPTLPPQLMSPGARHVAERRRNTHASVVATIQRAENQQLPDTRGAVNGISHIRRLLPILPRAQAPLPATR